MSKKLQKDSKYEVADSDGDGIVTDAEMDRHATWIRLENEDKQADTQRMMAIVSMFVSIVGVAFLLLPVISLDRMDAISSWEAVPDIIARIISCICSCERFSLFCNL